MVKNVKIEVQFLEGEYIKKLEQLKSNVVKLNSGVALCKEITSNDVKTFSMELVNQYLKSEYTFKNLEITADALGVKSQYIELKALDRQKESLLSEFITENEEGFFISESNLIDLKESYTIYLNDDKVEAYNKLQKVVELMNSLTTHEAQSLQRGYDGQYYVNTQRLNIELTW